MSTQSDSDKALAEPQGLLSDAAINYAKSETVSSLLKVEAAFIAGAQWQRERDQAEQAEEYANTKVELKRLDTEVERLRAALERIAMERFILNTIAGPFETTLSGEQCAEIAIEALKC